LRRVAAESLNVTSGEARGSRLELDGELVIGRSAPELPGLRADTEMSRVHARVWRDGSGVLMIEDLGSRNGTFLNGSRIHCPRLLQPGDWLRAGRTTMEIAGEEESADGAPRYDALVEDDEPTVAAPAPPPEPAEPRPAPAPVVSGSSGHISPWPLAAIFVALLAGGALGTVLAASRGEAAKSTTVVVTRKVQQPPPPRRLAAPADPSALPQVPIPASRDMFTHAFCGQDASAPKALCACTYDELTRREPYAAIVSQVADSHGRRIAPPILSAARACGAD
jgi:hypothetical protein